MSRLVLLLVVLFSSASLTAQTSGVPKLGPLVDRWTPPRWALAEARKMGNPTERAKVLARWKDAPEEERITIWRAGLRLRAPEDHAAAVACGARLSHQVVDAWESRRVVELCLPEAFKPRTEVDYGGELRYLIGCDELPEVFAAMPENGAWGDVGTGKIHVYVRAEHIPMLCERFLSTDLRVREAATEALGSALQYSDRHRDAVAAMYRRYVKDTAVEEPRAGLPFGLRRCLHHVWKREDRLIDELLLLPAWSLRWLDDCTPVAADEGALIDLLRDAKANGGPAIQVSALRALGRIGPSRKPEVWSGLLLSEEPEVAVAALAARARRGDTEALKELVAEAASSGHHFGFLLDAFPDRAQALLRREMIEGRWPFLVRPFAESWDSLVNHWGLNPRLSVFESLQPFLVRSCAKDVSTLARAFLDFPGFRCHAVAEAILWQLELGLSAASWPRAFGDGDDRLFDEDEILGFIEAVGPDRLLQLLRRASRSSRPEVHDFGCRNLIALGDRQSGQQLVKWFDDGGRDRVPRGNEVLLRSLDPAVLRHFEREAAEERTSFHYPLARALGLPFSSSYGDGFDSEEDERKAMERLRKGDPLAAVALCLPSLWGHYDDDHPFQISLDLCEMPHPRIIRYLQGLRRRRALKHYWWATSQLARMGDPECREEIWQVVTCGRYVTMDAIGDEVGLTLGREPDAVRYWLGELETQCCRIASYGGDVVHRLVGLDCAMPDGSRVSARRVADLWQPERGDTLVWSKLLDRFVIVPGR